jgi:hypothetical protein
MRHGVFSGLRLRGRRGQQGLHAYQPSDGYFIKTRVERHEPAFRHAGAD